MIDGKIIYFPSIHLFFIVKNNDSSEFYLSLQLKF